MTDQVQLSNYSAIRSAPEGRADTASPEIGSFRGQTVQSQPDQLSLIQDSAEELTFGLSETVEKKISARKKGKDSAQLSRLMALISKLQGSLPDFNKNGNMQRFVARLLELLKNGGTPGQVKDLVKEMFPDSSHQFAALATAKELLAEAENSDGMGVLDEAMQLLEAEDGEGIRAGLNISVAASEMEREGLSDVQHLRDFYRSNVLGFEDIMQAYESIIKDFGETKFEKTLEFLMKAISADIDSLTPSTDRLALKEIHDSLFQTRMLGDLHQDMGTLIDRMKQQFSLQLACKPQDLVKDMMNLLRQQFISEGHFRNLVEYCRYGDLEAKIDFLREWNARIRRLPLKIYARPDQRGKMLEAGQAALDGLITEEEEGAW